MAQALDRNTPWRAETDGQAVPPAVVCALNGSPPGRAAAAYAAALARALEWRLGLVASGLRPLELPMLVQAVIDASAAVAATAPGSARSSMAAAHPTSASPAYRIFRRRREIERRLRAAA